ncbi:DUF5979 domain-containing protein [Palleronia caenipelagi]|uniref:Peptidoglycan-binding protein n=1 Tax=Palleronia caenipelagi TaxID=2489174 RepID=A0A547PQ67_9RHOB|nr:DUF5979 domain-containing protein [Palleronia caenipelagi]TRD16259.1 peptidoglycan-binding protein [Palleronia caenipelagi]
MTELPRCVKLEVTKAATPSQTGPQGPFVGTSDISYTVEVLNSSNSGADGAVNFGPTFGAEIRLTDVLSTSPMPTLTLQAPDPCAGTTDCDSSAFPSTASINTLAAQGRLAFKYTATPNPGFSPDRFCNTVRADLLFGGQPFDPRLWYIRGNWQDQFCVDVRNRVTVTKVLDLPPNITLDPAATFDVTLNCDRPAGPGYPAKSPYTKTIDLTAQQLTGSDVVWVGSNCTVSETPPDPSWLPGHCSWDAPAYAPASFTSDASQNDWDVTVTNRATCEYRDVTINKSVITASNPQNVTLPPGQVLANPVPNTSIQITLECEDGIPPDPDHTLTFPVGLTGGSGTLQNVEANMSCTVTETTSPQAPAGCQWTSSIGTGTTFPVSSLTPVRSPNNPGNGVSFDFDNVYTCTTGAQFEIVKQIVPSPAWQPGTQITFDVTGCTNGATPSPSSVTMTWPQDFSNGQSSALIGLSGTSGTMPTCAVTETVNVAGLPRYCGVTVEVSLDGGATWQITPTAQVQSSDDGLVNGNPPTRVLFRNNAHCEMDAEGSISKGINNAPGFVAPAGYAVTPPPAGNQYVVDMSCTGGGTNTPNVTRTFTLDSLSTSDSWLAFQGQTCTFTERQPPAPAPGCYWAPVSYTPSNSLTMAGGNNQITVHNTYLCSTQAPAELVVKKIVNPGGNPNPLWEYRTPPANTVYGFPIICNNPPSLQSLSIPNPAGGSASLSGLPVGADCEVTEAKLTNAARRCKWETTITPPGGLITLKPGQNVVTVTNRYLCRRFFWWDIDFEIVLDKVDDFVLGLPPIGGGMAGCSGGASAENPQISLNPGERQSVTIQPGGDEPFACQIAPAVLPDAPEGCAWQEPSVEYSTDGGESWTSAPPEISFAPGIEGNPEVLIRPDLQCEPDEARLEVEKTCTPDRLDLTGDARNVPINCTLIVRGENLPEGHDIRLTDTLNGARPISVQGSTPDGGRCQLDRGTGQTTCMVSGASLGDTGEVSVDLQIMLQDLAAETTVENCVTAMSEGPDGTGIEAPMEACAIVEITRAAPPAPDVIRFELDKASLEDCSVNREAQSYDCPFGLEIRNTGTADFTGPMVLTDRVIEGPAPTAARLVEGEGWTCPGVSEGALTCLNGTLSLPAGRSDRVAVNVTLPGLREGGQYCNRVMTGLGDDPTLQTLVVQQAMGLMGIDVGPTDGKAGPRTEEGVRELQERLGQEPTGQIDGSLLTALGVPSLDTLQKAEACVPLPPMPAPPLACHPATSVKRGEACVCRYSGMVQKTQTSCGCKSNSVLIEGKGCIIRDRAKPDPLPVRRCDPQTTVQRGEACVCRFKGMRRISPTQCQ